MPQENDFDKLCLCQREMVSEESDSELRFGYESKTECFVAPLQISPSPLDALIRRWCVADMRDIYTKGVQSNEWGKPARSIYEKPRIIFSGLDSVPDL